MCTLEAILHSRSVHTAHLSFLCPLYSLYPMKPPFKTSISILLDNPWVSMDSNTSSPLKQSSDSSSDHYVIHTSRSHSASSGPLKTRNVVLGIKTDTVTHQCHLKPKQLPPLLSKESGLPWASLPEYAQCYLDECRDLAASPGWAADFPHFTVLLDSLPTLCLMWAFLVLCQLFLQAASFPYLLHLNQNSLVLFPELEFH